MSDTVIVTEPGEGIRLATLSRPARRNALDRATYAALGEAVRAAGADEAVRVLVLTGAEGCFTSGNDLADFRDTAETGEESAGLRFLKVLAACPKPVIAAVEGFAIGIGTTLLLHCDLAYAGRGARFRLPFVPLGSVAGGRVELPAAPGRRREEGHGAPDARRGLRGRGGRRGRPRQRGDRGGRGARIPPSTGPGPLPPCRPPPSPPPSGCCGGARPRSSPGPSRRRPAPSTPCAAAPRRSGPSRRSLPDDRTEPANLPPRANPRASIRTRPAAPRTTGTS